MADVHKGHNSTGGIKLFGKTIMVQVMRELKEEPAIKSEDEDDRSSENKRPEKVIPCPRCKSMDTKFCYFNNYNVNQPRHYCKGCQRYWTAGGALRNVPIGAGRRKAKPSCGRGLFADTLSDGNSFFGDVSSMGGIQFNGMMEEWQTTASGDFRHVFPAKRRRNAAGEF